MCCAKTDEPIEMQFGDVDSGGPGYHALGGSPNPSGEGTVLEKKSISWPVVNLKYREYPTCARVIR